MLWWGPVLSSDHILRQDVVTGSHAVHAAPPRSQSRSAGAIDHGRILRASSSLACSPCHAFEHFAASAVRVHKQRST